MGAGHSHAPTDHAEPTPQALAARKKANWILAAVLVPLTLLTLAAMVMMWPSGSKEGITLASPYAAAPGVTFDTGKIQRVVSGSCMDGQPAQQGAPDGQAAQQGSQCTFAYTEPDKGGNPVKVVINPDVAKSHGVKPGDNIRYLNLSKAQGASAAQGSPAYVFVDFVRTLPIIFLAVLYAVVVIAVARWRGLRALIGLVGAYAVLVSFMLPGLVEGKPPLLLALVGSTVIMIGVLYFAHGFSARTSTALLGTMFGLGITALLAAWATDAANLAGVGNHDAATLANISDHISISGIILCGLIISGLGVLNDVTITQSSAVWELWELAPETVRPPALHLRHADRPGPHRLHRLHHRVRLRRRGPAHPDHRDALRAAPRGRPHQRRTLRGSDPHARRLHRAGPGDPRHHADRGARGQSHRNQGRRPAASG